MRMAASSWNIHEGSRRGTAPLCRVAQDGLDELKGHIKAYREAWRQAGHDGYGSVFLRVPVYAAATEQAAYDEPRECIIHYFERQARMIAAVGAQGEGGEALRAKVAEALNKLSYDDIWESRAAIGTPERLIERFIEWRDVAGIDGVVMELNAGNLLGEEQISNSVRLIAEKVMPAFK